MNTRANVILLLLGFAPALFLTACGDSEAQEGSEQQATLEQSAPVKVRSVQSAPCHSPATYRLSTTSSLARRREGS